MARKENADQALDVIGKTMRVKDEIDREFDEKDVKSRVIDILPAGENQESAAADSPNSLHYSINSEDFGLNVICNINLGRAYQIINPYEEDSDETFNYYNVSPDAQRFEFSEEKKFRMNKEWINHILRKIKNASTSTLILENIFDKVTTKTVEDIMPYIEQVKFAYELFNDEKIKGKIIALVRGTKEQDILKNNHLDLMYMLGKMLGIEDRVINPNSYIEIKIKDKTKPNTKVRICPVSIKTSATTGFVKKMTEFIKNNPGADIYYSTDPKINLAFDGITNTIEKEKNIKKPCSMICFGPMCSYDIKNCQTNNPYDLNRFWHKVAIADGEIKTFFQDYNFPQKHQIDTSSFVGAVSGDKLGELLTNITNSVNINLSDTIGSNIASTRKKVTRLLKTLKMGGGQERLLKTLENKNKKSLNDSKVIDSVAQNEADNNVKSSNIGNNIEL